MATSLEYAEFVCEQIRGVGSVRHRKMFGEYMVYVHDKPVLLVCDNTVYVKKLPELEDRMQGAASGFPYQGAKEHHILDIDDAAFSREIVMILERVPPLPRPKKKKAQGQKTR